GIRDLTVTGVQTCALPIFAELAARFESPDELGGRWNADVRGDQRLLQPLPRRVVGRVESSRRYLLGQCPAALAERVAQTGEESRSEERRVGKESRPQRRRR